MNTLPIAFLDRKSGSAGMPRPISYAVFCLKKKKKDNIDKEATAACARTAACPARLARRPPYACRMAASARPGACLRAWLGGFVFFFFNDTATTEIYTLSLHDALPIYEGGEISFFYAAGQIEKSKIFKSFDRSEERFSRNAETDIVCRLLLVKKNNLTLTTYPAPHRPPLLAACSSLQLPVRL